jgi:two-component system, chemotaxis family, sensor kinase CheA
MKTRMQPIGNAWQKLPRIVRDLSAELGKEIDLEMQGAETELDRQVLELVKHPLTHLVRNCADHGIESAAQRRAVGKAPKGRITLSACHQGGHIIIQIADDGRGLDLNRIRAKAVDLGLASEAAIAAKTDAEICNLIVFIEFIEEIIAMLHFCCILMFTPVTTRSHYVTGEHGVYQEANVDLAQGSAGSVDR